MSSLFRGLIVVSLYLNVVACGSDRRPKERVGSTGDAIINGTAITDPIQVEATKNVQIRAVSGAVENGSGTLLSNDWVLTAAHVITTDNNCAVEYPPASVDITLGDISQGHQTRKADRFRLHPRSFRCGIDTDMALAHVVSPFLLDGSTTNHSRPITDLNTDALIGRSTTCYGYGSSTLGGPAGPPLRFASFQVRPYPAPPPYTTAPPLPFGFTVMKGGGAVHSDTGSGIIPYTGDSGGPCIDPTDPIVGREDVWGILSAVDNRIVNGLLDPRFSVYTAASAFRDFARSVMAPAAPPVQFDIDFDGSPDTFSIRDIGGLLFVEIQLASGPTFDLPPFGIPQLGIGDDRAFIQTGDFNGDSIADLLGYIDGTPFYFHGVTGFDPAIATPTNLQLASSYEYMTPGDFNRDGVGDVSAIKSDGSEDVYLGVANVGLTVPGEFIPKGFNYYGPPDEQTVAISSTGVGITGGAITAVPGAVYVIANDTTGFFPGYVTLDATQIPCLPSGSTSVAGDGFGAALTWGSFDGSPDRHALVISAPEVQVGGQAGVGSITVLSYENGAPAACKAVVLDPTTLGGAAVAATHFGRGLAAGDFNGDGLDDVAIVASSSGGYVQTLLGVTTSGLSNSSPQSTLTYSAIGVSNHFGAMTAGDFNCDGFEDLALGTGDDVSGQFEAGAVTILYGGVDGLSSSRRQRIDKTDPDISTAPLAGEVFGDRLAAGNFNGDSFNGRPCVDLAITADEGVGGIRPGAVYVLSGTPDGLTAIGSQRLVQGGPAADGTTIADQPGTDAFGGFLAITRADTDRFDDLIVAAWNENLAQGAAHVLRGGANGITAAGQAFWQQGSGGIPGTPSPPAPNPFGPGNRFGWSVGGTSNGLIAVGAAWQSFTGVERAGWAALVRVNDASPILVSDAFEATEAILTKNVIAVGTQDAFFGAEITKARPAFVPQTGPQTRYAGPLVLASGTSSINRLPGPCINDTSPPEFLAVTVSPDCIWPPNEKLVSYQLGTSIQFSVHDDCDRAPSVRIVAVTSSEPESVTSDVFFGEQSACVRAERLGTKAGRTYTVTLEASDDAGHTTLRTTTITVPMAKVPGCGVPASQFVKDGDPSCSF